MCRVRVEKDSWCKLAREETKISNPAGMKLYSFGNDSCQCMRQWRGAYQCRILIILIQVSTPQIMIYQLAIESRLRFKHLSKYHAV